MAPFDAKLRRKKEEELSWWKSDLAFLLQVHVD